MRTRRFIKSALISLSVLTVVTVTWSNDGRFTLPGTQPETINALRSTEKCNLCHGGYDESVEAGFTWGGNMMAHAARDPLFYAALTIAEQDKPESADFCLRCHSPVGWLEGRSKPGVGAMLTAKDREGVQCDFCHQLVDPMTEEGKALVESDVPGYGNAMYIVSPGIKRGPYADVHESVKTLHRTAKSDFYLSGHLCGTCHDVSNTLFATDVTVQAPHEYGAIERTYSEWFLSDYAKLGREGTCQSCHMGRAKGYGTRAQTTFRDDLATHDMTGGNAWIPDTLPLLWKGEVDKRALRAAKQRAIDNLQRAAILELSYPNANTLNVRITNLTGHKLPTGYPEGRQMWLNVKFFDDIGKGA